MKQPTDMSAPQSNVQKPLKETPSQTAGPYVHIGLLPNRTGVAASFHEDLTTNSDLPAGSRINITGRVFDGAGDIVKDVLIESWQAGPVGREEKGLWHRCHWDIETGLFSIQTVTPGRVKNQRPHLSLWIVARGINVGLHTRIYFPEHDGEDDPLLSQLTPERAGTMMATVETDVQRNGDESVETHYMFDIHLQGDQETVFLDV